MLANTPQPSDTQELLLIQHAVGLSLRQAFEHMVEEPVPAGMAMLLLQLAFMELLHGAVREECESDSVFFVEAARAL